MQSGDIPAERLYKIIWVAEKGGLVRSQQCTLQNGDRTVHRYWLIGYRSHIYRPLEAASIIVSAKMEWSAPSISGNAFDRKLLCLAAGRKRDRTKILLCQAKRSDRLMTTLAKWSVEDYHRMIAAGILRDRRVELLAGDILQMSPEGPLHASRIRKIANYLRSLLHNLALVSEAHPITLQQSEPEPDIAIVRLPESRYDERHPGSEDIFWLIEIADTTLTFDLNKKKQIYAAAGISEYWVMNVKANSLTVFRQPIGNDYSLKYEMSQGELIPLAFPEIAVSVERLFS